MVCACQRRAHPSARADELPGLKLIQIQSDVSRLGFVLVKCYSRTGTIVQRDRQTDVRTDRVSLCRLGLAGKPGAFHLIQTAFVAFCGAAVFVIYGSRNGLLLRFVSAAAPQIAFSETQVEPPPPRHFQNGSSRLGPPAVDFTATRSRARARAEFSSAPMFLNEETFGSKGRAGEQVCFGNGM